MQENKAEMKEYVPPSRVSPEELAKALMEDGVIESSPAAEAKPELTKEAPAAESKPAEKAPETKQELPALLRLAKERDAFRKEMEQAKPHLEALRAIPTHSLSAIVKAISAGDPVGLITAAGMTHSQYNARMLGTKDPEKPVDSEKPKSEYDSLRQEVEALRKERENERLGVARTQVMGQMREILKDNSQFSTINGLGDYDGVERVLIQYYQQHGALPGETLEESVKMAAEVHEAELKKQADRWRPILTGTKEPASVSPKAPESKPSTGTAQTRTLTNANTTAPAAPRAVPKTRTEIIEAIVNDRDIDL